MCITAPFSQLFTKEYIIICIMLNIITKHNVDDVNNTCVDNNLLITRYKNVIPDSLRLLINYPTWCCVFNINVFASINIIIGVTTAVAVLSRLGAMLIVLTLTTCYKKCS